MTILYLPYTKQTLCRIFIFESTDGIMAVTAIFKRKSIVVADNVTTTTNVSDFTSLAAETDKGSKNVVLCQSFQLNITSFVLGKS